MVVDFEEGRFLLVLVEMSVSDALKLEVTLGVGICPWTTDSPLKPNQFQCLLISVFPLSVPAEVSL